MLIEIRRLWAHLAWADAFLLEALEASPTPPAEALREYAHILGADEVWLARVEQRPPTAPVWPQITLEEIRALAAAIHAGYARYVVALDHRELARVVSYTNSAGDSFQNTVQDILLHVALHAQYHRGKINQLLRQAGLAPAPTDYIAFVRGAPAVTISESTDAPLP
jgi:uncharacterized damage-inducible protein DinB